MPPEDDVREEEQNNQRRCPYCFEAVQSAATICSHCGMFIDPRYPNQRLDEGTYRYARMLVLEDVRHEILRKATIWLSVFTALAAIGGYYLIGLVAHELAKEAVDDAVKPALEEEIGSIKELQQLARTNNTDINAVRAKLSEEVAGLRNELQREVNIPIRLARRTSVRMQRQINQLASRLGEETPRLILRHPNSLEGEKPDVFYQSQDEAIRFAWDWMGEPKEPDSPIYRIEIGSANAGNDQPTFVQETTFQSLKVSFQEIANKIQAVDTRGKHKRSLYWTVTRKNPNLSSPRGVFEYYEDAMDRMRRTRELRIGITAQAARPFVYEERKTLNQTGSATNDIDIVGLDIGIAEQIAQFIPILYGWEYSIRPIYHHFDWQPLLNALATNQVDLIISQITITEERESEYGINFSDPYFTTHQAILYKAGSLQDFGAGQKLASHIDNLVAQEHTTGLRAAQQLVSDPVDNILIEDNFNDVVNQVLKGDAVAAVLDWPIALEIKRRIKGLEAKKLTGSDFLDDYGIVDRYGIAVRNDQDELHWAINLCLRIFERRGILDELRREYTEPESGGSP